MYSMQKGENQRIPYEIMDFNFGWNPHRIGTSDIDALAIPYANEQALDSVYYHNQSTAGDWLKFNNGSFRVDFNKIPACVERIDFVLIIHSTVEGAYSFGDINTAFIELGKQFEFSLDTVGLRETLVVMARAYKKDGIWKFKAVGQGFKNVKDALANEYGINQLEFPSDANSALANISLKRFTIEKRIERIKDRDQDLAQLIYSIDNKIQAMGLLLNRAKVALILDISSSTASLYRSGKMQSLVERALAIGFCFDDNAEIDVFLFGDNAYSFGSVGALNYKGFVNELLKTYALETDTRYGRVIKKVRDFYLKKRDWGAIPVYAMFVTDGATQDAPLTKELLIASSFEPIFWSFMAIGQAKQTVITDEIAKQLVLTEHPEGFDFLYIQQYLLDKQTNNSNFFITADPADLSDDQLFENLMQNYLEWQIKARSQGILKIGDKNDN